MIDGFYAFQYKKHLPRPQTGNCAAFWIQGITLTSSA